MAHLLSEFQNLICDSSCKKEMEDKILNPLLAMQKEPLSKQNSITRYYST